MKGSEVMNSGMTPGKAFCWAFAQAGTSNLLLWSVAQRFMHFDYRQLSVYFLFFGTLVLLCGLMYRGYRKGTGNRPMLRAQLRGWAIFFSCLAVVFALLLLDRSDPRESFIHFVFAGMWSVMAADYLDRKS